MKVPAYTIAIDEEGYPMLSGLRIDDETFNYEIFSKMRRLDPSLPASAIVTESGGKEVLVDSFAAPLVAQSVENVDTNGSDWIFLAGVRHHVEHKQLRVDAFHRVHAPIGPDKIPAMLSRKAHSQLLMPAQAPTAIRDFYDVDKSVSQSSFWQEAYQKETQGWELSAPSPVLVAQASPFAELRKKVQAKTGTLMVPGAGRGHDAEFLSSVYSQVTAVDFAPSAEPEHKKLYPKSTVQYLSADIFAELKQPARWDGIFEHTIFCAIDPTRRQEYLEGVHNALADKGLYFGVFWLRLHPMGPPFGLDAWELRERTRDLFEIYAWELSTASVPARYGQELWAVFSKKTR